MFSRNTILKTIDALNFQTYDQLERFCLEFNIDNKITGRYLKERATSIAKYLIANPGDIGPNGSNITIEVIEYAIKQCRDYRQLPEELTHSLDRDGYEVIKNGLRKKLPKEIPVVEQENQLISLLDKFGFTTAKRHYELAVASHSRGEWASSNAQLRNFVEEFFNKTQEIICPGQYQSTHERRNALAKAGFFIGKYNEWLSNGTGFVEGFYKRLHTEGSHPGLSEQTDSTFRLHLVILVIHYFLTRLETKSA